MSVLSLLTFSLPVLMGTLLVHLLWADRKSLLDLILQLSLGTGLGLGISSLLYYVYLIFFAGSSWFLYLELALFFAILAAAYLKHKKTAFVSSPRLKHWFFANCNDDDCRDRLRRILSRCSQLYQAEGAW